MAKINNLGQVVKARRRLLGLSQKELADKCGFGQGFISRLEAGLIMKIGSDLFSRLAVGLQVSAEYLSGQVRKLDATHLVEGDRNANYLLQLYAGLTGAEIGQLITYAEFMRYRGVNYKRLMKAFMDLLHDHDRCAESNTVPDKESPALLAAQEVGAQIVFNQASREVEMEIAPPETDSKTYPEAGRS